MTSTRRLSTGRQPQIDSAGNVAAPTDGEEDVVALQGGQPPQQPGAAHSARLLDRVLAGMGSGSHGRHGRIVPAGRTRSLRLPHRLLLAGASARSAQSRAQLDEQLRRRAERLAQNRSGISIGGRACSLTRQPVGLAAGARSLC